MWKCNRCGASTPKTCTCPKAGDATPPATPQPETPDRIEVIAREIAKVLMTNSLGERCDRLAQLLQGFPLGCGWSLDGATAMIRETLEQEGYILDRMAEATRRAQLALSPPPDVERLTAERNQLADRVERLESQLKMFADEARMLSVRLSNAAMTPERIRRLLSSTPGEPT